MGKFRCSKSRRGTVVPHIECCLGSRHNVRVGDGDKAGFCREGGREGVRGKKGEGESCFSNLRGEIKSSINLPISMYLESMGVPRALQSSRVHWK